MNQFKHIKGQRILMLSIIPIKIIQYLIIQLTMQTTSQFQNFLKLYIFLAVAMGIVQMANYQMNRKAYFASNETQHNTTAAQNYSSVDPRVKVYATMRLEPIVRSVFQENNLNPTIQSYELHGIDWLYNICLNYGHIVLCIFLYNHFKSATQPAGYKVKILIGGAIAVFAWIYLANQIAIEKLTVKKGANQVLFHSQSFDKEKFSAFVKENAEQFEVKKIESQIQEPQTSTVGEEYQTRFERVADDVQIDPETGSVYTKDDDDM